MPKSKKNRKLLEGKAIIVDTCLLIQTLHSVELFEYFFDFVREDLKSILVRIVPIYIEYVNGLPRDQQIEGVKGNNLDRLKHGMNFIEKITKEVEVKEDKLVVAKMFADLFSLVIASGEYDDWFKKEMPKPSFIDHLIGAMSFHKDIIIATLDHKDFPLYLYDRIYLKTFDLKNEIFTVGFYKVNEKKYSKLVDFASKTIKKAKLNEKKTKKNEKKLK